MSYHPQRGIWVSERNRFVFGAFEILSELLERDSPDAAALLKLCSIHGSLKIPAELIRFDSIKSFHDFDKVSVEVKHLVSNQLRVKNALDYLVDFGIAKYSRNSNYAIQTLTVHGLLCQWTVETILNQLMKKAGHCC